MLKLSRLGFIRNAAVEGLMIETSDLVRVVLFKELLPEELEAVKHLVFERAFKAGSTLFLEGMKGDLFYIVKTGQVEILKKKDGEEVHIASLGPGQFVGEMSIIDDEPRSATAKITEDSVLLIVTRKCFLDIVRATPAGANKILMAMLKIVNQRLREANRKLLQH
jgi:CRP/FNR family transcriptional regulator, cyclic AMP receptor protein